MLACDKCQKHAVARVHFAVLPTYEHANFQMPAQISKEDILQYRDFCQTCLSKVKNVLACAIIDFVKGHDK